MTDDKNLFEISRRQALAGLGTIGVASAGAGLGTSAYFNDTEEFTDNKIKAGTLDITVTASGTGFQDGMGPEDGDWYSASSEGDNGGMVGMPFEITDLKPGDEYELCWCIANDGNPAVVRALIPWDSVEYGNKSTADDAADLPGVDSVDDFENPLGSDHITVSKNLYVCDGSEADGDNILENDITYEPNDPGGWDWDGGLGNWASSLGTNPNSSQDGVPIGGHDGVGSRRDSDLDTGRSDYILIGDTDDAHFSAVAYCMTIHVSPDAGNELQNAWAEFDLQFIAEQARHNDEPFDGYATRPRTDSPTDWTNYPV